MSVKKKTVAPAPKKADTLRALKYLRKTVFESRRYHGPVWDKYEAERKRVHKANKASLLAVLKDLPAEEFKQSVISDFVADRHNDTLAQLTEAAGYKPLPGPLSPRGQQEALVAEIDAVIHNIMLSGDFALDYSALIKRAEKLMGV